MKGLNELSDVLNKLNKLNFTSVKGNALTSEEGWSVNYNTELSTMIHDIEKMPVQIVLRISFKGKYIMTWGCCTNEENTEFVKWFLPLKSKAYAAEDKIQDQIQDKGKDLFSKL